MNATITAPTVRDLFTEATERGVKPSELLPPVVGYTLAEGCSDYYVGPETKTEAWTVAGGWDADTSTHCVEAWTISNRNLTPAEALEMAAALTAAAKAGI